ncbi:unnamed protein product [Rhizoctonia solani]|uniref:Uncharacterized protein n=1 Tax=Rhizoctonia solani TaxID=456999 RepID=A0A8H2WG70_9AGAM|nr:unnamed protein product [Rhizoctonia solani]
MHSRMLHYSAVSLDPNITSEASAQYSNLAPYEETFSPDDPTDDHAPTALRLDPDHRKPRLGMRAKILVPTLVVFVMTAGLGIAMIAWLFSRNILPPKQAFELGYILADEGVKNRNELESATLRALTAATFISTLISTTSPVLMLLVSYRIAYLWIKHQSQAAGRASDAGPTPLQYGMMTEILSSPSIMSIGRAILYLARRGKRASAPSYFWKAVLMGVVVYIFTHLVGLADLWVHTTTSAVLFNRFDVHDQTPIQASLTFNDSICPDTTTFPANGYPPPFTCGGSGDSWATGYPHLVSSGLKTISNSSLDRTVITLADENDLAIMVPNFSNTTTAFFAHSFGIRASCKSLSIEGSGCDVEGPTTVNCSDRGITILPSFGQTFPNLVIVKEPGNHWNGAAYGDTGSETFYLRGGRCCAGNPAQSVVQLSWNLGGGIRDLDRPNQAVIMMPFNLPVRLYATCDLAVYNLTVAYKGSALNGKQWSLVRGSDVLSSPYFSDAILAAYAWNSISDHAAINIKSRAMTTNSVEEVMAGLNQEMSRLALGMTSGMFYFSPASDVSIFKPVLLGRYYLAPLFTFVLLLFIYGFMALVILVTSFNMRSGMIIVPPSLQNTQSSGQEKDKRIPVLELVRLRLSSPIPMILQFFARPITSSQQPGANDPDARSVSRTITELFPEADTSIHTENRLRLGVEDVVIRPRFGIWSDQVMKDKC